MKADEIQTVPVFIFPTYGCQASGPIQPEQAERENRKMLETLQKHWNHEGVKALVQLIEREAATALIRAVQPVVTEHSREHQAGQGYALQQLIARLQNLRLAKLA